MQLRVLAATTRSCISKMNGADRTHKTPAEAVADATTAAEAAADATTAAEAVADAVADAALQKIAEIELQKMAAAIIAEIAVEAAAAAQECALHALELSGQERETLSS